MCKIIAFFALLFAIALVSSGEPPEARTQYIGGGVPVAAPSGVAQSGAAVTSAAINAATNTIAVTVNAGESLFVCLSWYQGGGQSITSVTWNTTESLTQVGIRAIGSGDAYTAIYAIGAPTAGSHNVVATFVNANTYSIISATKWTGTDTTTPYHDAATAATESSLATVNVSNVATGEVTLGSFYLNYGDEDNPGTGVTLIHGASVLGTSNRYTGASGKDSTSTGTVTMSWNGTTSSTWSAVACAIKKAT